MAIQQCERCGADLPPTPPDATTKCAYCGAVQRVTSATPHAAPAITDADLEEKRAVAHGEELGTQEARIEALKLRLGLPPEVQPASRTSLFGCAVVVALVAASGVAAFLYAQHQAEGAAPAAVVTDVDRGEGWVKVRPDGMPGRFERFDPVAAAPWALSIARQWAPDARVESVYVTAVAADGTLHAQAHGSDDVAGQPEVDYRFVSDARRRAAARRIEVAPNDVRSSFRLVVENGMVAVSSATESELGPDDGGAPPELDLSRCPLARVVATMRRSGMATRPAWDLVTTWDGTRWTWWVNMTDVGSVPNVDAATCDVAR